MICTIAHLPTSTIPVNLLAYPGGVFVLEARGRRDVPPMGIPMAGGNPVRIAEALTFWHATLAAAR